MESAALLALAQPVMVRVVLALARSDGRGTQVIAWAP